MAVTVLDGYPQAVGGKMESVAQVTGSASYSAGGQSISAAAFGLQWIESGYATSSDDGSHFGSIRVPKTTKVPASSVYLQIFIASSGSEGSGDLSAETLRVHVRGY